MLTGPPSLASISLTVLSERSGDKQDFFNVSLLSLTQYPFNVNKKTSKYFSELSFFPYFRNPNNSSVFPTQPSSTKSVYKGPSISSFNRCTSQHNKKQKMTPRQLTSLTSINSYDRHRGGEGGERWRSSGRRNVIGWNKREEKVGGSGKYYERGCEGEEGRGEGGDTILEGEARVTKNWNTSWSIP